MKKGTEHLNYGRDILARWGGGRAAELVSSENRTVRILDVGCGHGTDLFLLKETAKDLLKNRPGRDASDDPSDLDKQIQLEGVENYPPYVKELKEKGVVVHTLDIERDVFPGKDGTYDIIIANQVLEHTKEIFWITSEIARLLKPGGVFLMGVPNLASLHNRLLLLFGIQPTAIQLLSAHVRGFTVPDVRRFVTEGELFEYRTFQGSNFYPFPPLLSRPLAKLFPHMAWGIFFYFVRTNQDGKFIDYLFRSELETPFYGGPFFSAPHSTKKSKK